VKMKVLVIGADGQLGTDLCRVLKGPDLIPLTQNEIEITSLPSIEKAFSHYRPEIIINTAAFVRVDDCESQMDVAFAVNALGARNVAVQAEKYQAKLLHISTDYVFGGGPPAPPGGYTEFDQPFPLNTYGRSKLAGEELVRTLCHKHMIIRTSGLFGVAGALGKGGNFVETMLKLAKDRPQLTVVNDQVFSPTYSLDMAERIAQLMLTENYGVFHIANSGSCSWYEFTQEILKLTDIRTPLLALTSAQYPQKALRPSNSILRNYHTQLLGLNPMRPWPEALKEYLKAKGHLQP
jgi:dTDP-4-dehydrorhamnose reductase